MNLGRGRVLCASLPLGSGAELSVCPSCPQAQKAKVLSDAENELEELAVATAQAKKVVELIKVILRWLRSVSLVAKGQGGERWCSQGSKCLIMLDRSKDP